MMVPSGIRRDENERVAVHTLANGAIVVLNAYEGRYDLPGDAHPIEIKEIRVDADQALFDPAMSAG